MTPELSLEGDISAYSEENINTMSEEQLSEAFRTLTEMEQKLLEYQKNHLENYKMRYSKKGLAVRKSLNVVIKNILSKLLPYEVKIEGYSSSYQYPVLFASSHQDNFDLLNSILSAPTHFINLNSSTMKKILKAAIELNGGVYVNRDNKDSKHSSKDELISYLLNGYSVNMYPEGAYNLSPNKLHIPYHIGLIDIAQKSGKPIIPVVQEYVYGYRINKHTKKEELYVKKVYIKFGQEIFVKADDKIEDKFAEFNEAMSTLGWELMEEITKEEKGRVYFRSEIDNKYYKDFIEFKRKQIEAAGSSIEEEERAIYNGNDKHNEYLNINAIDIDAQQDFRKYLNDRYDKIQQELDREEEEEQTRSRC